MYDAMCGTDLRCAATRLGMSGTDLRYAATSTALVFWYFIRNPPFRANSQAATIWVAIPRPVLAIALRGVFVLRFGMLPGYQGGRYSAERYCTAYGSWYETLLSSYAMPGTDRAYDTAGRY
eukprot:1061942-Rhodomonas_salina.4